MKFSDVELRAVQWVLRMQVSFMCWEKGPNGQRALLIYMHGYVCTTAMGRPLSGNSESKRGGVGEWGCVQR